MPSKPPFAEPDLQQESKDSDQQTCRVSAVRRKIQAEREIDKSPDNRLRDVVCQTHSAVKAQAAHFSAESFILIKQHKRRYQNQRKSKFLPHIKCRPHTLPDNRVLSITSSFNVYKGAKATADTISIFIHRCRFFPEVANSCFLPI